MMKLGVLKARKPFDVIVEGLVSKESGGNRAPMELFLAGIAAWDSKTAGQIDDTVDMAVKFVIDARPIDVKSAGPANYRRFSSV